MRGHIPRLKAKKRSNVGHAGWLGCLLLSLAGCGSGSIALGSELQQGSAGPGHTGGMPTPTSATPNASVPSMVQSDQNQAQTPKTMAPMALALHGCYQSDYATSVQLGDGNIYNLLVDTGSMALAVAASDCDDCQGISPRYTPSTAAANDHKNIVGNYGGGNGWEGAVYTDVVALPPMLSDVQLQIAAISSQSTHTLTTTAFFNSAYCTGAPVANTQQGILGLAPTNLGPIGVDSFADQIARTSKYADVFAFQFCDINGQMWWGGYDPSTMTNAPLYTPMDFSSGYYLVQMLDIEVNGVSVGASASNYGDTLADTGTSLMLVPTPVFNALTAVIESNPTYAAIFGQGFLASGACQALPPGTTRDDLDAQLPAISLVFAGSAGQAPLKIKVPPTSSYLLAQYASNGTDVVFCAGVSPANLAPLQAIVGNSIMHSQITIFDRAAQRLGFATSRGCNRL